MPAPPNTTAAKSLPPPDERSWTVSRTRSTLIVSSTGKKIHPSRVENLFKLEPLVSQILLVGDRLPYLTALFTVNTQVAETLKGMEPLKGRPAPELFAAEPVADPDAYAYLKSYSPYDNVRAAAYPAMYVTAARNDQRVGYWEPAKWVAKLRERQTGDRPILLWTDLGVGHAGSSVRYDAWREEARVQAFILSIVGIPD